MYYTYQHRKNTHFQNISNNKYLFNQSYLEKPLLLKALLNIAQQFPVMTQNLPEPLSTFRIHKADVHLSTDWLSFPGLVLLRRFWELSACSCPGVVAQSVLKEKMLPMLPDSLNRGTEKKI